METNYETMFKKVKYHLGNATEGEISSRTIVEIQENGDVHFRQKKGIIDGAFYWYTGDNNPSMVFDLLNPEDHLKTLRDVRVFLGLAPLFSIDGIVEFDGDAEKEECKQCRVLEDKIDTLDEKIARQAEELTEMHVMEAKVNVYENLFRGRRTIHIKDR